MLTLFLALTVCAPPQAPPLLAVAQAPPLASDCGCAVTGRCGCGPACACPACQRPATKRADDGGPDWCWDWQAGQWVRPAPVPPRPYYQPPPMRFAAPAFFGGGSRSGARGGSC